MIRPQALIVEDDPFHRFVFELNLSPHYDVESVQDGVAALTYLERAVPDLVMLDLDLVDGEGELIVRRLYNAPQFSHTCLILCTADPHKAHDLQDQANFVLLKPVRVYEARAIFTQFFLQSKNMPVC
jgi:CheY-like chemotaxis protein